MKLIADKTWRRRGAWINPGDEIDDADDEERRTLLNRSWAHPANGSESRTDKVAEAESELASMQTDAEAIAKAIEAKETELESFDKEDKSGLDAINVALTELREKKAIVDKELSKAKGKLTMAKKAAS